MLENTNRYSTIALVKEIESPENPKGLEKRVALTPDDVGRLVQAGITVYVESGAGDGIGFSDEQYLKNNAIIELSNKIYKEKELIIKLKGPSISSIEHMKEGCTLFCMAHFSSFPERAKLLSKKRINVIAMEKIYESPKKESDERICARVAMNAALNPFLIDNRINHLHVRIIGWSERLRGAIHRCGNRNPHTLQVIQPTLKFDELDVIGSTALYFYDAQCFKDPQNILAQLKLTETNVFDLNEFDEHQGKHAISSYRDNHPPLEFGMRRIQCLHETGQAGARYGMTLLGKNKPFLKVVNTNAVVLGYGNVAQGAMDELYQQGVKKIHVLGRSQTSKKRIDFWLKKADIIINGAEQPPELRGKSFLISNQHLLKVIPKKSVIIDLVGGSADNRSPVEAVINCTFLTSPYFKQNDILVSSLWGWPMLGMMHESAIRYSHQIVDVLIGYEKLIDGLKQLKPGVQQALVCGPYNVH